MIIMMEIEILTTKKKLTKQLISQMRCANSSALKHGQVLGFLINVKKADRKIILIKYKNDYLTISANQQKFEDLKLSNEWWDAYQSVIEKADVQIYI